MSEVIDHVGIRVSDLPASRQMYEAALAEIGFVVLSEGEYRAIAKNEGKVFERPFNVVNGVDGEVEVIAR